VDPERLDFSERIDSPYLPIEVHELHTLRWGFPGCGEDLGIPEEWEGRKKGTVR
jgi:hypothetical protein